MATSRRWRPRIEVLENRALCGSLLGGVLDVPPPVLHHVLRLAHHHLALAGQASGEWTAFPVTSTMQTLTGSGGVRPLGRVQASGTLETPGLQVLDQTQGTLTLTSRHGSLTLSITGPLAPGAAGVPPLFQYTLLGGTRRYKQASGGRVAMLTETPEHFNVCPPPLLCPVAFIPGQFTLTLVSTSPSA